MSKKITQLTADTSPSLTDLAESVKDPSGTPLSRKITLNAILNLLTSLTAKTSLVDADQIAMVDSAASNVAKKITWANVMTQLAAYTTTLTNKRITRRVVSVTASATPTINTDNGDIFEITGQNAAITSLTTNLSGTPTKGQMFQLWITDDGTPRTVTPGASFAGTDSFSLTGLTTTASKRLILLWEYTTVWELVGKLNSL